MALMDSITNAAAGGTGDMFQFTGEVIRDNIFDVNRERFPGFMWVAALDHKTCKICAYLDGKIYSEAPNMEKETNVTREWTSGAASERIAETREPVVEETSPRHYTAKDIEIKKKIDDVIDDSSLTAKDKYEKLVRMMEMEHPLTRETGNPLDTISYDLDSTFPTNKTLQNISDEWFGRLTDVEIEALRDYTRDSASINNTLLQGLTPSGADIGRLEALKSLIDKQEHPSMMLRRGMYTQINQVQGKQVGDTIQLDTFISSTIAPKNFTLPNRVFIFAPEKVRGAYLGTNSWYPTEGEFLLPPGTNYRILFHESGIKGSIKSIIMLEVLP